MRCSMESTDTTFITFIVLQAGTRAREAVHELEGGDSPPCITARRGGRAIKKNIAKPPLIAAKRKRVSAQPQEMTGWFSDENKRKTTPSASASVASRHFLDDASTPPCGDARRGVAPFQFVARFTCLTCDGLSLTVVY